MQLAVVDSGRQVAAQKTATARTTAPARESAQRKVDRPEPLASSATAPMRGGLRDVDASFNRQVAGAQQALEFLDRAGEQLQVLQTALSSRLAGRQFVSEEAAVAGLEQQIARVGAVLRERSALTGGTLDDQLGYDASGRARQKFSVRGLQFASLRSGERETLDVTFGRAQRVASVVMEHGLSDAEIVQRFDKALAPSGIRAGRDAQGELSFSVPESAWPAVRATLAIKGEGRRFPTGQFSAVRVTPDPAAIRPHEWSVENIAATRRTLQQVMNARELVRDARQGAGRALGDAGQHLLQRRTTQGEAEWNAAFARTFETTAARGDYQALAAITPALLGISRERVTALLGAVAS